MEYGSLVLGQGYTFSKNKTNNPIEISPITADINEEKQLSEDEKKQIINDMEKHLQLIANNNNRKS
jgi:hypothetical protein